MKPYNLIYDAVERKHLLNDEPVPSVTEVIPKQDYYVSPERLEECRQEGEDNHDLIKMYWLSGETFNNPMLVAFDEWIWENSKKLGTIVMFEKPIASLKYKYCGRPDMLFQKAVVDMKRSPGNPMFHALQTAGYNRMAVENEAIPKTKIHLIVWYDGTEIKSRNVYNDTAESVFLALVKKWHIDRAVQNYFKEK